MGNVAEAGHSQRDRDGRAQEFYRLWLALREGAPRSGSISDEEREEWIASSLMNLCRREIIEAVLENPVGSTLLGLRITFPEDRVSVTGKLAVLRGGVYRALEGNNVDSPIPAHIKSCMASVLSDAAAAFDKWFYEAEAEQLLPLLLSLPRPSLERIVNFLNRQQRVGLRSLLYNQLGGRPILLRRDREPEEQRRWLYWYLWYWELTQPKAQQTLGGIPDVVFAAEVDEIPRKKTGEPLDPLGPILAKVWQHLGPEIHKHGATKINNPHSKSRISRSLGVDRSTLERYFKADIGKEPKPDNKGRVTYQFTDEDAIRAMEEVTRKRGPRRTNR